MTFESFARGPLCAAVLSIAGLAALACSEASGAPSTEPRHETAASPAVACGAKGQPDCPLQGWMKATVQQYLNAGDKERLAASLTELARHAPPGFDGWEAAAKAGADAALAGDVAGVRAQCQGCHQKSRAKYRAERRSVRLF